MIPMTLVVWQAGNSDVFETDEVVIRPDGWVEIKGSLYSPASIYKIKEISV